LGKNFTRNFEFSTGKYVVLIIGYVVLIIARHQNMVKSLQMVKMFHSLFSNILILFDLVNLFIPAI